MPKATDSDTMPLPIPQPPFPRPYPLPEPPDDERAPRRRTMLAGIVAALAFPAVAHSQVQLPGDGKLKGAHPDADLIRICAEHIVNLHAYEVDGGYVDVDEDPLWAAYMETHDAIGATPAQTLDGIMAKARVAKAEGYASPAWADRCPESGPAVSFSWDVVGDLLRLGGQA